MNIQINQPMLNQGFNQNTTSPYGEITNDQIYQETSNPMSTDYNNNTPVNQDIRRSYIPQDDHALEANKLLPKKNSKHVRSLIASFILVVGIATVVALYITGTMQVSVGALIGICVGIYLFYLILALCGNPLFAYLGHIEHGGNFQGEYNKVRSINGHFVFHVVCYHYQTRFHVRTVRDANGNTRTQTYTTQQKVITHTATEQLIPKQCKDQSGNPDIPMASTQIIFVHNKVNYRFRDERSRNQYEFCWVSFMNRHRRDAHQDYSQNFVLPGLVARITFYVGEKPKNYMCLFVFWSIFGLIWPYSMYLESKVCRFDIQYMKVVGL